MFSCPHIDSVLQKMQEVISALPSCYCIGKRILENVSDLEVVSNSKLTLHINIEFSLVNKALLPPYKKVV